MAFIIENAPNPKFNGVYELQQSGTYRKLMPSGEKTNLTISEQEMNDQNKLCWIISAGSSRVYIGTTDKWLYYCDRYYSWVPAKDMTGRKMEVAKECPMGAAGLDSAGQSNSPPGALSPTKQQRLDVRKNVSSPSAINKFGGSISEDAEYTEADTGDPSASLSEGESSYSVRKRMMNFMAPAASNPDRLASTSPGPGLGAGPITRATSPPSGPLRRRSTFTALFAVVGQFSSKVAPRPAPSSCAFVSPVTDDDSKVEICTTSIEVMPDVFVQVPAPSADKDEFRLKTNGDVYNTWMDCVAVLLQAKGSAEERLNRVERKLRETEERLAEVLDATRKKRPDSTYGSRNNADAQPV